MSLLVGERAAGGSERAPIRTKPRHKIALGFVGLFNRTNASRLRVSVLRRACSASSRGKGLSGLLGPP